MPTYQYRCEKCGKRFERTETIPPPPPPPKGRVEADYNKANQDTRITSFPDVLGTELRGAAVARTLKPSCVELLACQIEQWLFGHFAEGTPVIYPCPLFGSNQIPRGDLGRVLINRVVEICARRRDPALTLERLKN